MCENAGLGLGLSSHLVVIQLDVCVDSVMGDLEAKEQFKWFCHE